MRARARERTGGENGNSSLMKEVWVERMNGRDAIVLNEFEQGGRCVMRALGLRVEILCADPGDSIAGGGYGEVVLRTLADPAQLVRSCGKMASLCGHAFLGKWK